jgi:hypothetical protein
MSAIRMTCDRCGGQYIAGVVGRTPWPAHECPNATPLLIALDDFRCVVCERPASEDCGCRISSASEKGRTDG